MDPEITVIACPHNNAIDCSNINCETCGWHPDVIAKRKKLAQEGRIGNLKLYKLPFTGFCEVWATSPEDASEKADNGLMFYVEHVFDDPICLAKEEEDE
jgi:hypothetical protein